MTLWSRCRRAVALVLVTLLSTALVACGGPTAATVPTYSDSQILQIEKSQANLQAVRDRFPELDQLIAAENWTFVRNFIRGPLGDVRRETATLSRTFLDPALKAETAETAQALFNHLIALDDAAKDGDVRRAREQFQEAIVDFDAFLQAIPTL
ncbi:photosystem II protein PsbQ [Synechococcus elongatus]|nr:photosystem II protein PsbQ [Synechococcus elongatus]WKW04672.1 photosystem II protein PsbQ [Synechococcus elongatus PCC 7942 = FACHB-805]